MSITSIFLEEYFVNRLVMTYYSKILVLNIQNIHLQTLNQNGFWFEIIFQKITEVKLILQQIAVQKSYVWIFWKNDEDHRKLINLVVRTSRLFKSL